MDLSLSHSLLQLSACIPLGLRLCNQMPLSDAICARTLSSCIHRDIRGHLHMQIEMENGI